VGDIGRSAQAVGNVAAAGIQAGATTYAANKEYDSANNALDFEKGAYSTQQSNAAPYLGAGKSALSQLSALPAFTAPTAAQAQATPGYQFQLQQGQNALSNKLISQGLAGGNAGTALENYTQGLAGTNYQNTFNNALQTYNANEGKLSNIAAMGLSANGQAAAGAQNFANQSANLATQQGNAIAGGVVGTAAALTSIPLSLAYLNGQGQGSSASGFGSPAVQNDGYWDTNNAG
jgi:hypothetical protein